VFLGWPNCHDLPMNPGLLLGKAICERRAFKQSL
jgi:hypothetical protein